MPPRIAVVPGTVRKVCQLTGEYDRERRTYAFNRTESRFGLFGTDLGSSFEHGNRLWFLFGDTWPGPGPVTDSDSIAWSTDATPEPGLRLDFVARGDRYRSPRLRDRDGHDLSTGSFEVPIAGFSANDQMYLFYSTSHFSQQAGDGGLDVFWVGPDDVIRSTWANPGMGGANWHEQYPIGPSAVRADSALAIVLRPDDALDLFWIDQSGSIMTGWANPTVDNGGWHPPFPITPPGAARANSPLAAVSQPGAALDAFWIGPDGAVGTTWANPGVNSGIWNAPFPITPPGAARANSPLAAVSRPGAALDAFWIGPDGAVATTWANPGVNSGIWHPPFPITPPGATRANSPLAAVVRPGAALDAFWIGPDGAVATTWANPDVNNGIWNAPFPITPPGAARADSPLAAVVRPGAALDVFWIGPDGAVATTWANPGVDNGAWHAPFPITPPGATGAESPLAAVVRLGAALDVFWIGPDGAVGTTWANPDIDGAAWHPPFPIARPGAARPRLSLAAATRNGRQVGQVMGRTVLAAAADNDPTDLVALYDMARIDSGGKFINIACVEAGAGFPDLPFAGRALLAWGSGWYRHSDVFFACIPLDDVRSPDAWRYFTGFEAGATRPSWSADQTAAAPLFFHHGVGELSVSWIEPLGLWLMLLNAGDPRGIQGRVAAQPWGPWSEPLVLFDASLGYGHFMHLAPDDGLSDPGRENEPGGEYGPYLIHRFTRAVRGKPGQALRAQVYFTMSTWNPYNTVLMTAEIERIGE